MSTDGSTLTWTPCLGCHGRRGGAFRMFDLQQRVTASLRIICRSGNVCVLYRGGVVSGVCLDHPGPLSYNINPDPLGPFGICRDYNPPVFPGRVSFNKFPELFIQRQGSFGQCCHGNRSAARSFPLWCLSFRALNNSLEEVWDPTRGAEAPLGGLGEGGEGGSFSFHFNTTKMTFSFIFLTPTLHSVKIPLWPICQIFWIFN